MQACIPVYTQSTSLFKGIALVSGSVGFLAGIYFKKCLEHFCICVGSIDPSISGLIIINNQDIKGSTQ